MKIVKRIAAAVAAAALCLSSPASAYADFYQEPATIKGVLINEEADIPKAVELGVSQVITNFHTSFAYSTAQMNAYERYLKLLKEAGISVTLIVLNDWDAAKYNKDLLPVAEKQEGVNYYAFNTLTQEGCEATWDIAQKIVGRFSDVVSNWVIGNEVNDGHHWNYIGNMDIDSYCNHYAMAYEAWYTVIKQNNSLANVYIPFDYRWNILWEQFPLAFKVVDMLPRLNSRLKNTDYGIAWHAYPADFDDPDFRKDNERVLDTSNSYIITLKNLHVLTDYMQQEEMRSPSGNVRHLILSEQGFTSFSSKIGGENQALQADCIAAAYQAAAANPYVEAFMLNRLIDDYNQISADPTKAYGLLDASGNKKLSWEAYKNVN